MVEGEGESVLQKIQERMETVNPQDICSVFLLSVENKENKNEGFNLDKVAERTTSLLSRFFRITDIVGYLGDNRFIAFLTGKLPGSVIWEKAETLTEALWLSEQDISTENLENYIGVYVFRNTEEKLDSAFQKAEHALRMAKKDPNRNFFIYTVVDADSIFSDANADSSSSTVLRNYVDEAVRLLTVKDKIEAVYTSPAYLRRLTGSKKDGETAQNVIVHKDDLEAFEKDVHDVVRTGEPKESGYRISVDGFNWTACRIRLLRIPSDKENPSVLEVSHNISGLEHLKSQYDEEKKWLGFLTEETDFHLWEVDIKTRVFTPLNRKSLPYNRQTCYPNFPESLIENGIIQQDSAGKFREFAREMLEGTNDGRGNFSLQYKKTNCYSWFSVSYQMLYDEEGRPEKAIGISKNLSSQMYYGTKSIYRRQIPEDIYPNLYLYAQVNLTTDTMEKLLIEGRDVLPAIQGKKFSEIPEILDDTIDYLTSAEDADRFRNKYNRTHLLSEFEKGRRWFYDRCQIVNSRGEIQKMSVGINLTRDTETNDIRLFVYLQNRNRQHEWENEIESEVAYDLKSGLYDSATAKYMAKKHLDKEGSGFSALAEISMYGAENLFNVPGKKRRMLEILTALNVFLGSDSIMSRDKSGRIFVFFPDAVSATTLKRRIENAFYFTRISLSDIYEIKYLRFTAGVIYADTKNADYNRMKNAAGQLTELHANESEDRAVFSVMDFGADNVNLSELKTEDLNVREIKVIKTLSEEDKATALECLGLMLKADDADSSVNAVLAKLGEKYQASRVYTLSLPDNGRTIIMLNEWCAPDRFSIKHSISGKQTSLFPVIERYAKSPRPLILSTNGQARTIAHSFNSDWSYALFPMEKKGGTEQCLCIEDAKCNMEQTGLIEELIPFLGRERERFHMTTRSETPMEQIFMISNMQKYKDKIYSITSDKYTSLGVISIEIPRFNYLKEQKGYEYGTKFFFRIFEILLNTFGRVPIFHTKESEFVVLCTDISYKSFFDQYTWVRRSIEKEYGQQFRIGCTWSDGIFKGEDLVEKARSIMKIANPSNMLVMEPPQKEEKDRQSGQDTANTPAQNKQTQIFTIYLQPKIDMRTGNLSGAEALVRVMDENGKLLPHGSIISGMEENGTIQNLDCFVFDKTLSTLSEWRRKGYKLKPISSNFSRKTILNPTALASVLAIFSRYPNVPQDLVELEITETAGSFENNTFMELIQKFGEYGLKFSLDDFGSNYSNMSMLAELPFHSVKLDRSMVRSMTENSVSKMMVRDIAKICESCNMLCIAEGVETQAQVDSLIENGCFYAQGYFYGKPMPIDEFERKYFQTTV